MIECGGWAGSCAEVERAVRNVTIGRFGWQDGVDWQVQVRCRERLALRNGSVLLD